MTIDQAISQLDRCKTAAQVRQVMKLFRISGTKDVHDCPICRFIKLADGVEKVRVAGGHATIFTVTGGWMRIELTKGCEQFETEWHEEGKG